MQADELFAVVGAAGFHDVDDAGEVADGELEEVLLLAVAVDDEVAGAGAEVEGPFGEAAGFFGLALSAFEAAFDSDDRAAIARLVRENATEFEPLFEAYTCVDRAHG